MILRIITFACLAFLTINQSIAAIEIGTDSLELFRWSKNPEIEQNKIIDAEQRLQDAINNPEYVLDCWVELPFAPEAINKTLHHLSLKEAILLALRYNPNIQSAELDRIITRYQLRLAQGEFEMQYAFGATALIQNTHFSGVGNTVNKAYVITPELSLKNKFGGELSLNMNNKLAEYGNYDPLVTANFTQPLLRGFGQINEYGLLNAFDNENLNKLNLQQTIMDEITEVVSAYQALVLSSNTLSNQKRQLLDAKKLFQVNEKKITTGFLESSVNIQQSYQIESLNMMVEQAEMDFKISSQNLLQVIGLSPVMRIAVPNDISIGKISIPDIEESITKALAHNTQFISLNLAVIASERAYDVAKNQQLWQLDFNANVQAGITNDVEAARQGIASLYSGDNLIEAAGITLTIPLHDLNRRNQLITAKIQLEKSRLNLRAYKQALVTTIKNTISTIASLAKRYELAKKQVMLAEQSYVLEKKKQENGFSTSLEVNNTQNQLIQAQTSLIGAKIAYLNQLSALHRLIGTTLDEWQIKLRYC